MSVENHRETILEKFVSTIVEKYSRNYHPDDERITNNVPQRIILASELERLLKIKFQPNEYFYWKKFQDILQSVENALEAEELCGIKKEFSSNLQFD